MEHDRTAPLLEWEERWQSWQAVPPAERTRLVRELGQVMQRMG